MKAISVLCSVGMLSALAVSVSVANDRDERVARGEYLVAIGGCNDCHTPGHFLGHEDPAQTLAGSDVGFADPVKGVVVGPNLTPDKATGLGTWTDEQIQNAFTGGVLPDGKLLSPIMPWPGLSRLSKDDARAIVAYPALFETGEPQDSRPVSAGGPRHRGSVASDATCGLTRCGQVALRY